MNRPVILWDQDVSEWVVYDDATRRRLSSHPTLLAAEQWILSQKPEKAS